MLKWIAGGMAAFLAGRYLLRLNRASDTLVTRTTLKVNKVGLSGLELKAKVRLQNPNPISLSILFPFVNVTHNRTSIGSSKVKNETLQLPANGEKTFELTIQSVGWLSLIQTLGTGIVQQIRSGQKVVLNLLTTVSSRVNGVPFEKKDSIQLSV